MYGALRRSTVKEAGAVCDMAVKHVGREDRLFKLEYLVLRLLKSDLPKVMADGRPEVDWPTLCK